MIASAFNMQLLLLLIMKKLITIQKNYQRLDPLLTNTIGVK